MSFTNEKIWIIGASSGIGKDLAILFDKMGANLVLSARRENNLQELASSLDKKHMIEALDITDYDKTKEVIEKNPDIDRVIFMSAIYQPSSVSEIDIDFAEKSIKVNLVSAINLS